MQDCEICNSLEGNGISAAIHLSNATKMLLPQAWAETLEIQAEPMVLPSGGTVQTHVLRLALVYFDVGLANPACGDPANIESKLCLF